MEKVSFEPGMNSECVMEGESSEQVGGELESDISRVFYARLTE